MIIYSADRLMACMRNDWAGCHVCGPHAVLPPGDMTPDKKSVLRESGQLNSRGPMYAIKHPFVFITNNGTL